MTSCNDGCILTFETVELAIVLSYFPAGASFSDPPFEIYFPFFLFFFIFIIFQQQPSEFHLEIFGDKMIRNVMKVQIWCCPPPQEYWFSLVFKRLVGPRVLAVRVAGLQRKPQPGRVIRDKLRIYAHCTSNYKYVYIWKHLD